MFINGNEFLLLCILCYGRGSIEAEIARYVGETYPKGVYSIYCVNGKDADGPEFDFELVVVISATRHSPQNFWYVHSHQNMPQQLLDSSICLLLFVFYSLSLL